MDILHVARPEHRRRADEVVSVLADPGPRRIRAPAAAARRRAPPGEDACPEATPARPIESARAAVAESPGPQRAPPSLEIGRINRTPVRRSAGSATSRAPGGSQSPTAIVPPSRPTSSRQTDRPRPFPSRGPPRRPESRWKGSKTRSRSSGGMPGPVSANNRDQPRLPFLAGRGGDRALRRRQVDRIRQEQADDPPQDDRGPPRRSRRGRRAGRTRTGPAPRRPAGTGRRGRRRRPRASSARAGSANRPGGGRRNRGSRGSGRSGRRRPRPSCGRARAGPRRLRGPAR